MTKVRELDWYEAYNSSLKGKIVDDAFSHPAKMAWGLTVRIFQHLFEEGWLREENLVADPFGGIGSTGLVAASFGCPCILVELEQKFVDLAEQNFELHREQWEKMGKPMPVILQGDSHNFSTIIREVVSSIVCSPPYSESPVSRQTAAMFDQEGGKSARAKAGGKLECEQYGSSPGQIGAMKEGELDEIVQSIITSPPYFPSGQKPSPDDLTASIKGRGYARNVYGDMSEGQLGGMPEGDRQEVLDACITSPPYVDLAKRHRTEEPYAQVAPDGYGRLSPNRHIDGYSHDPANMGNLPEGSHKEVVDAICTSPPYEKAQRKDTKGGVFDSGRPDLKKWAWSANNQGGSPGQISNEQGDTYWSACRDVYCECLKALKPGGVMAVVVKSFVKNKVIIDLPSQTLELLEAIGFDSLEYVRAWLTSPATQKSLMPEIRPDYTKKKASFFRRLYESKYPENKIDFEVVLIVHKPV